MRIILSLPAWLWLVPCTALALSGNAQEADAPTPPGLEIDAGSAKDLPPDLVVHAGRLPSEVVVAVTLNAENLKLAETTAKDLAVREGLRFVLKTQSPEKSAALMQMVEPEHRKSLVRTMSATDEVRTVATYRATLHILYDTAGLEALIGHPLKDTTHDSPKAVLAPAAGQAALVIPVWAKAEPALIWEAENPWRKALARAALEESKGRLILPPGDAADQRAVTAVTAPTLTFAQAAPMAERYGASEVLIARATPMPGNNLRLQLQRLTPNAAEPQEMLIAPEEGADADTVMRKAASEVAALARKRFQNAAASSAQAATQTHQVRVLAPITRAADWAGMRARLSGLSMVESVTPISLGTDAVELDITFRGPPERFGAALKGAGIHATPQADKLLLGFYPIP